MARRRGNTDLGALGPYKNDRGPCCCFMSLFPIAFTKYNCSPNRFNSQPDEQGNEILPECSLAFTSKSREKVESKEMLFQ